MDKTYKTCKTCNKEFEPSSRHLSCPMCRHEMRKKKCPSCNEMIQNVSKMCLKCFNSMEKQYKIVRHAKGYDMVKVKGHIKNHGYKFIHTIAMEEHIGRELLIHENVHHINGVRDDNRIENLELWTKPQPSGIRASDALEWARDVLYLYEKEYSLKIKHVKSKYSKGILTTKEIKHSYNKAGYIMCNWRTESGEYRATFEHVIVMEKYIGRDLLPQENVHHINGVRDDNRIENLELWTKPQPSGIRASDALEWAKEIIKLYS